VDEDYAALSKSVETAKPLEETKITEMTA